MLESAVETQLVEWCKENRCLCLKLAIIGMRGFPDRTVIDEKGRITFIELKRPKGGKRSAQQEWWFALLESFYQTVVEVRSLEDAVKAINR
jgi:hypothetical protein